MVELNIGLEVGRDGEKIPAVVAMTLVYYFLPHRTTCRVEDNTLVVRLESYDSVEPVAERILLLSRLLCQDCIAAYDGEGYLIGDRADAWAPFNMNFFVRFGG